MVKWWTKVGYANHCEFYYSYITFRSTLTLIRQNRAKISHPKTVTLRPTSPHVRNFIMLNKRDLRLYYSFIFPINQHDSLFLPKIYELFHLYLSSEGKFELSCLMMSPLKHVYSASLKAQLSFSFGKHLGIFRYTVIWRVLCE